MFWSWTLLSESAKHAEGTFKYPIHRHMPSFWHALAFMIVKGVPQHMPPLEIIGNLPENPVDNLGKQLHQSLWISPHSSKTTSVYTLHASSSLSQLLSLPPSTSSASTKLEMPVNEAENLLQSYMDIFTIYMAYCLATISRLLLLLYGI